LDGGSISTLGREVGVGSRLEACDTADWKSALRNACATECLRYGMGAVRVYARLVGGLFDELLVLL
jgi:hypothetical protein